MHLPTHRLEEADSCEGRGESLLKSVLDCMSKCLHVLGSRTSKAGGPSKRRDHQRKEQLAPELMIPGGPPQEVGAQDGFADPAMEQPPVPGETGSYTKDLKSILDFKAEVRGELLMLRAWVPRDHSTLVQGKFKPKGTVVNPRPC